MDEDQSSTQFDGPVWIPNNELVFEKVEIVEQINADEFKVKSIDTSSSGTKTVDRKDIQKCNPVQFEKCNDMASLTFLNEPSVINNLKLRYFDDKIYTYSGLFLVAINPYKKLNIYNKDFINFYKQPIENLDDNENNLKNKTPHIFSIAQEAFENLINDKKNQSILVTGESGAGKTENTKKIIKFILNVSTNNSNEKTLVNLQDQIINANPILESFGNATTVKNLNSSRFGKFIKIKIQNNNLNKQIIGSNIEWYLLEKSRVILQDKNERNYHVFYQLLRGSSDSLLETLKLKRSIKNYNYLKNSITSTIENIDDVTHFKNLKNSFKIMNFDETDITNIFKILSIILHLGNITFKYQSNENRQAIISDESEAEIVDIAEMLEIPIEIFKKSILTLKIKIGKETVIQERNSAQSKFLIDALSKILYEKLFGYLVNKINKNFNLNSFNDDNEGSETGSSNYIGILDIAGFEIFEKNSFEQLCINYTNEKLQQFFNHHMFVLEQSEYLKEGISWKYIDFGNELKPTIELIEGLNKNRGKNKIGIFSILDEECVVPKGNDHSFMEKLYKELEVKDKENDSKSIFKPNRLRDGFIIKHYAGEVDYSVDGWLDKNKDPLSNTIIEVLSQSSNAFISKLFENLNLSNSEQNSADSTRKKSGIFRTVTQLHKEQLTNLMTQLSQTHPHFVRCILPNNEKSPGIFDNKLVLDQLRCNGVLEGIRIARSGYPNRIEFKEFVSYYGILANNFFSNNDKSNKNFKQTSELILNELKLDKEVYKVGLTKLFFRNGVLASLEKQRDEKLSAIFTKFNSIVKGNLVRKNFKKRFLQLRASKLIDLNFRKFNDVSHDPWFKLISKLKPSLDDSNLIEMQYNNKIKIFESQIKELQIELKNEISSKMDLSNKLSLLENSISGDKQLINEKDLLLKTFNNKILSLENDLELKNTELLDLNLKDSIIENFENEKIQLNKKIKEIESNYKVESNQLNNLKEELSSLRNSTELKEFEFKNLEKDKNLNNSRLEKKVKETEDRLNVSLSENKKLNDLVDSKKKSINEFEKTLKEKHIELENVSNQLKQQKEINAKKEEELSSAKSHSKDLESMRTAYEQADRLKIKFKQLKHELKEVKNLLNEKINDEIEFDKGRQSYDKEISQLKKLIEEIKKQLDVEKRSNVDLELKLKHANLEIEKLNNYKKSSDMKLAELNLKLSQKPELVKEEQDFKNKSNLLISPDIFKLQDELQLVKTRLASESYENRQLRAQLKKCYSVIGIENINKNKNNILTHNVDSNNNNTIYSDSLNQSLEMERESNKRLQNRCINLQKDLLQYKNNVRDSGNWENNDIDYKGKYQMAEIQMNDLKEQIKELKSEAKISKIKPLTDSTKDILNQENIVSGLGGINPSFMNKESISMKQENLRLSSKLNEMQTKLKRLHVSNNTKFEQEEELVQLKNRLNVIENKNSSLQESVNLYRERSEDYYSKLSTADIDVQRSLRDKKLIENELNQLKEKLNKSELEFRESDGQNIELHNKIRNLERDLSDKIFEIRQLKEQCDVLKDKFENSEELRKSTNVIQSTQKDNEVKLLNEDLIKSINKETELNKQVRNVSLQLETSKREAKQLKFTSLELTKEKSQLQKLISETMTKNEKLLFDVKENGMKVNNLTSQVKTLKATNEDLERERNDLLVSKRSLESKLSEISIEFEEHLKKVQSDATNAINVVQLDEKLKDSSNRLKLLKNKLMEYQSKCKNLEDSYEDINQKYLITIEDNKKLTKFNENISNRVKEMQNNFDVEFKAQNEHWTKRMQELDDKLFLNSASKRDEDHKFFNLERNIRDLEQRNDALAHGNKRYKEEISSLENVLNKLNNQVDGLSKKDAEKALKLKRTEREIETYRERAIGLEKELLDWRRSSMNV